jgi:hypothetical protein
MPVATRNFFWSKSFYVLYSMSFHMANLYSNARLIFTYILPNPAKYLFTTFYVNVYYFYYQYQHI